MKSSNYNIIVLAAMPEEVGQFIKHLCQIKIFNFGDLNIYQGAYKDNPKIKLLVAWSGWGKVSASRAVSRIIGIIDIKDKIDLIIFTGLAGGADKSLSQWDIVLSNSVIQHDMDARPLFKEYVIPSLGIDKLRCDESLYLWAESSLIEGKKKGELKEFGDVKSGLIATGDKFINDKETLKRIKLKLPNLMAIEMEGAAVAQVATQENIPWIILRVISDAADESADKNSLNF